MQDTEKTKKQLIQELVALRQRLAACEAFNRQHQQTADARPESEAHFAGDICLYRGITERKQMETALQEVVIHDTGHGIAPEHFPHIFDPFYTTRHLDGGTGLGLSITYGIITEHGGTVDIASQVGHGTTVTLRLPGAPAAGRAPVHSVRQRAIKLSL
jgi:signal transduction histidine kinase